MIAEMPMERLDRLTGARSNVQEPCRARVSVRRPNQDVCDLGRNTWPVPGVVIGSALEVRHR